MWQQLILVNPSARAVALPTRFGGFGTSTLKTYVMMSKYSIRQSSRQRQENKADDIHEHVFHYSPKYVATEPHLMPVDNEDMDRPMSKMELVSISEQEASEMQPKMHFYPPEAATWWILRLL